MSIEEVELNVGGTTFKGVWIAILISFGSTLGGGIWAASEFFSRLEQLEETVEESSKTTEVVEARFDDMRDQWSEDKKSMVSDISVAQQQIKDAGIDELQGKLATLGTNLQTIMERQQELLEIQERIVEVEKQITETETLLTKAELMMKDADKIQSDLDRLQKEVEDLWNGLDYLSNPYSGEQ